MDEARLKGIPLFARLSRDERRRVAQLADEVDVDEGRKLISKGSCPYEFFVIEEGSADVSADDRHIAELGPGDFLGEMSALKRAPRTADVVATSPMTVIVMNARDLRRVDHDMPGVHQRLQEAIEKRAAELAAAQG